jgi:PAS domain S-box-containing protein
LSYAVAILSVSAALVAGLLLDSFLDIAPYVSLFICANMVAAWFGGVGPGLLSTVLSILAFKYFFIEPTSSFVVESKDIPRLALFAVAATFVVSLAGAQRNAAKSLRRARDDLQMAVRELERLNKELLAENAERNLAEQKIRQAERELQVTIDTIPVLVGSYRRDGSPDFVNLAWRDYTGLSLDDLNGRRWEAVTHPDDVAVVDNERLRHLATGEPFQTEQRLRRTDGEYRWHLFSRVPLRDENGNVIKWYAAGYDIEDRKRAEAGLRRSAVQLEYAQRLSRTGSVGFKVATGEIMWSEETARIYGYDADTRPSVELVLQRVHPGDVALVQQQIDRARQGEQEFDFEHRLVMPDGKVRHVHVLAHIVKGDSDNKEIFGALMDVSAAKQAREALDKAQAELAHVTRMTTLGELAASIAHEVNQPLTAIVTDGAAGLRWLGQEPRVLEEVRNSLEAMIGEAQRASRVIERIRALSKKTDPEKAPLDINNVIHDAVRFVEREVLSHRASLRLELATGLPLVPGDRVQLQQVVINLVINGVQAMESVTDRPRELLLRSQQYEADHVLVEVHDSGTGFDPGSASRLFNAFFSTKPGGMGMGLSICRSIIDAHEGRVWASNRAGQGAIFQFILPFSGKGAP